MHTAKLATIRGLRVDIDHQPHPRQRAAFVVNYLNKNNKTHRKKHIGRMNIYNYNCVDDEIFRAIESYYRR